MLLKNSFGKNERGESVDHLKLQKILIFKEVMAILKLGVKCWAYKI